MKTAGALCAFFVCWLCAFSAYAKETVSVSSNTDGTSVEITIIDDGDSSSVKKFDLSPDGKVNSAMVSFLRKGARVSLFVYLRNGKSSSMHYIFENGEDGGRAFELYDRHEGNGQIFALVDRFISTMSARYNFAKLARDESGRKRRAYLKDAEDKKRREKKQLAKMPPPETILKEMLKR